MADDVSSVVLHKGTVPISWIRGDPPKTPSELPVKLPLREHAFKIAFKRSLKEVLLPRGRVQPSLKPQRPPAARPA